MFCPKCGNQLPDGASFCGACGAKMEAKPQATPVAPAGASASTGAAFNTAGSKTAGKLAPIAIVAAICGIVTLLLSLAPWFETASGLHTTSSYASGFLSGLGVSNSFSFEEAYSVWNLFAFAGTVSDYMSIYGAFGGSGASGISAIVWIFAIVCMLLWIVSVIFIILGVVDVFKKQVAKRLRIGGILMLVTALVFFVCVLLVGSNLGSPTMFLFLTLIVSIITIICACIVPKKA